MLANENGFSRRYLARGPRRDRTDAEPGRAYDVVWLLQGDVRDTANGW